MLVELLQMPAIVVKLEETIGVAGKELVAVEAAIFPRESNQNAADSPAAAKLPDPIKAVLRIAAPQRIGLIMCELITPL